MASANLKVQPTEEVSMSVSNYGEAHAAFLAWHPKTLQREGAHGMTFDYLPVPAYRRYLDDTVGPGNWESQAVPGTGSVAVTLSVFSVRKSSVASVWPAGKIKGKNGEYVPNPQPNEVEKAFARAFRRAAAEHGLLSYLWEKDVATDTEDEDERPARKSSGSSKSSSNGAGSGTGLASANQIKYITDAFSVPKALAAKLTGGRGGQASALIDALRDFKKNDEDDYEEDAIPFIRKALLGKKNEDGVYQGIAPKLAAMLDEDEDDDSDED
jgi:hypothetical protein